MGPLELRQHPFLHRLQFAAQCQETAEIEVLTVTLEASSFRCSGGSSPEGERLLLATRRPVNNPFALPCSSRQLPVMDRRISKHEPAFRRSSPRQSGGSFQKKGGLYKPVRPPSTTLLHFSAEQSAEAIILQFWRKTLLC